MSSFQEDLAEIRRETAAEVALHINLTPKLYEKMSGLSGKELKPLVYAHAEKHNNEFGTVFQPLLDDLRRTDWDSVAGQI